MNTVRLDLGGGITPRYILLGLSLLNHTARLPLDVHSQIALRALCGSLCSGITPWAYSFFGLSLLNCTVLLPLDMHSWITPCILCGNLGGGIAPQHFLFWTLVVELHRAAALSRRVRITLHALCSRPGGGGITPWHILLVLSLLNHTTWLPLDVCSRITPCALCGSLGGGIAPWQILFWTLSVESHRTTPSRCAQSDHTACPLPQSRQWDHTTSYLTASPTAQDADMSF